MSTDYGEKERQFLATLKTDSGRDLAEWMAHIAAQHLAGRNEVIDWLRRQGFMFSKASWLERIHNNGGRPIYGDGNARRQTAPRRRTPLPALATDTGAATPEPVLAPQPQPQPPPHWEAPTRAPSSAVEPHISLDIILAKAKAFRPLAVYVLAEIAKAVPGSTAAPDGGHIVVTSAGRPFALLAVSAREVRLALTLGGKPTETGMATAKIQGAPAAIAPRLTHMAILTDARQINAPLLDHVRAAAKTHA